MPQVTNAVAARRTGRYLCFADHENYNITDLEEAQLYPILPISQAPPGGNAKIKPHITVISDNEFLILSWTGASTLGLFITGNGDPVRGTLQWSSYPLGICKCNLSLIVFEAKLTLCPLALDYPYVTTLLPDGTIEVHSVDSQTITQVVPSPSAASSPPSSPRAAPEVGVSR